jgi:Spy/CpxP family protein refolding chaperone
MHPGMFGWFRHAHRGHGGEGCGVHASPEGWGGHGGHEGGHGGHGHAHFGSPSDDGDGLGGGGFGVRRPLRFLAHKLDLDEKQVEALAEILDELKIERAQSAVDTRRSTSAFAEAVAGETLDAAKLEAAAGDRVKSAERVRTAVVRMLTKIHALLNAEQRQRLAYLLRTGALSI